MDQHEAQDAAEYPKGRGYGHDYMRGGEVFGGYGYSERADYEKPRGELADTPPSDAPDEDHRPELERGREELATERRRDQADGVGEVPRVSASAAQLEHVFGVGGNLQHSRSLYVTQAQLQQGVVGARPDEHAIPATPMQAIRRDDDAILRELQELVAGDDRIDASALELSVERGIVTLGGTVPEPLQLRYTCEHAWSVAGVRNVQPNVCERPEIISTL